MSSQVMGAIKQFLLDLPDDDDRIKPRHVAVLFALADECQDGFTCFTSLKRLARAVRTDTRGLMVRDEATGKARTPRNLARLLKDLEAITGEGYEQGIVTRQERTGRGGRRTTNQYQINLPAVTISAKAYETWGSDKLSPPPQGVEPAPQDVGVSKTCQGDTGVTPSSDTGVTPLLTNNINHHHQPEATGGGQGASPDQEEKAAATDGPDESGSIGTLGDKLIQLGVARENAVTLIGSGGVDHIVIHQHVARFIEERGGGSRVGAGFLVDVILGRKQWGTKAAKATKRVDERTPLTRYKPEEPEPPHEVTWACRICETFYSYMTPTAAHKEDDASACPGCGATIFEQEVPGLVAKGILPRERLERLPAKAREMLKQGSRGQGIGASREGVTG